MRYITLFLFALFIVGGRVQPAVSAELVMFESDGCIYCERWHDEIGGMYGKTSEGSILPLRVIDADADFPADLRDVKGVFYTPTFVIWDNGRELGRIRGYPGEEFFFPMLGEFIHKLGLNTNKGDAGERLVHADPVGCQTAVC